jgi:hypothetical protein
MLTLDATGDGTGDWREGRMMRVKPRSLPTVELAHDRMMVSALRG